MVSTCFYLWFEVCFVLKFASKDLTISIGSDEEPVRCHKHIVAMVSDVIQVEAMEKEEIFLSNISKDTLTQLIDYCYTAMIGPFVSKEQVSFRCITESPGFTAENYCTF